MRAVLIILFGGLSMVLHAQVMKSEQVTISFFSEAPLEDIESKSDEGVSALDPATGEIYFKVPIRSFEFKKSLMQEHFNENYLESDKYPYAEFKGRIQNWKGAPEDGNYPVSITGNLNIHGVTKAYTVDGKLLKTAGQISASSVFPVKVADHQIKVPRLVIRNIAEVVEVKISASYK